MALGFRFPNQKYSDEKALYINFRYLQEFLDKGLVSGGTTHTHEDGQGGTISHAALSDLTADDHTQYLLDTQAYRAIHVNTTTVGNVGAGEDDLMSFTVPAATLGTNSDTLSFQATGTFAASANNKRLRVKFGATTMFDTGALAITAASDWSLEGEIVRTGAATQKAVVRFQSSEAAMVSSVDYTAPTETLSGTVVFKLTGEATADNDVVQEIFRVCKEPAP